MQDWVAARAGVTPEKLALVLPSDSYTWEQLHEHVATTCAIFTELGIRRGDKLALVMPNCWEYVLCVYAAARLGNVIVPVNIRLTVSEQRSQLVRSDCNKVICSNEFVDGLSPLEKSGCQVFSHHDLAQRLGRGYQNRERYLISDIDLDTPLAIFHTSGTSGQPKGAVLTYGNLFYSAMASAYRLGHQPDDFWLCVLPLYHVGGLSILMRAILYGIAVDLHPRFDLDAINHALDSQPITLISLVPTMLYRLLESRTHWPESLRLILLGGAPASPDLLARCEEIGLPVATTYGLTEAASQVATMLPEEVYRKPGSVGKPLMFTDVKVVDESGKRAGPGEYGEVVVSGPSVMQGYYNDLDSTTKTLRNGELYTGDIGYLDDDGDLFVVQRRSDLIISGGENVYPVEVEGVLWQHLGVKAVAVVGIPDVEWGQRVAAAIVLHEKAVINEDELTEFCRERLAGYKLPRQVLFVDALPQTASGKIQRGAVVDLFLSDQ